ncbi:MAG: PfkB family carbohydrate kinase [Planctomycetota bacterium]|nr:PfkB family carbohydrate kinase [Planctomycetota bacterium]
MNTDRDRLKQIAARLVSPNVLVVGDLMLDRYSWCGVERISPEAPVPVLDVRREESFPGGACNVAIKAVELGGKASICGVVGQDNEGEHLLRLLSEAGVETGTVSQLASRPTTLKHRIIAQAQQVVRVDRRVTRTPVDGQSSEALFAIAQEESSKVAMFSPSATTTRAFFPLRCSRS